MMDDVPEHPLVELRQEVENEMDMMTAVATGGPRIQDVDREYQDRRRRIRALLRQLGLEDRTRTLTYGPGTGSGRATSAPTQTAAATSASCTGPCSSGSTSYRKEPSEASCREPS